MSTFTGFKEHRVSVKPDIVGDLEIYAKVGGSGPGLLLIHGYPQCHQCVFPPPLIYPHFLTESAASFLQTSCSIGHR
jgi:hypothetical protein